MFNDDQFARILLERSLVDTRGLNKARIGQGADTLYESVSREKIIEPEVLRGLAAELFKIPVTDIESLDIEPQIIKLVPASMAFRNRVIPIKIEKDFLILGMFDPTDLLAMDEVSTRTGVSIKPVGVDPSSLKDALQTYYGGNDELASIDALLDSMESPDIDILDDMDEMGWDEMFEQSEVEIPEDEAQRMRDRPTTGVLDIDSEDLEIADEDSLLEGLDDPISADSAYYDLDDWELDSAIDKKPVEKAKEEPPPSEKASLIMTKDSIDDFFSKEEEGGVAAIDSPPTRELEIDISEVREAHPTPRNSAVISRKKSSSKEGATQEITPNILKSIFSVTDEEISSLEENTAAHPEHELDRLAALMTSKPQTKNGKASAASFKIPAGVSEKKLLEALVSTLVEKGVIELATFLDRLAKK